MQRPPLQIPDTRRPRCPILRISISSRPNDSMIEGIETASTSPGCGLPLTSSALNPSADTPGITCNRHLCDHKPLFSNAILSSAPALRGEDRKISRVRLDRHDLGLWMKVPEAQRLDTDVRSGIDNHTNRIGCGIQDAVIGSEEVRHHPLVGTAAKNNFAAKSANREGNPGPAPASRGNRRRVSPRLPAQSFRKPLRSAEDRQMREQNK